MARQSAGVTLVKGDLRGSGKAIRLSRATIRNIRHKCSSLYLHASGIPVAAGCSARSLLTALPAHRRRRDEPEFRLGHWQRSATSEAEAVIKAKPALSARHSRFDCRQSAKLLG
jgi:hypothetical protein